MRRPGLRARRGPPPAGPGGRRAGRGVRQVPGHRLGRAARRTPGARRGSAEGGCPARAGGPGPGRRPRAAAGPRGSRRRGAGRRPGRRPAADGGPGRRAGRPRVGAAGPAPRGPDSADCRTPRPRRRDRPSYTTSGTARTRRTTPTRPRLAVTARKTIASHGRPWYESPIPTPPARLFARLPARSRSRLCDPVPPGSRTGVRGRRFGCGRRAVDQRPGRSAHRPPQRAGRPAVAPRFRHASRRTGR